MKARASGEPAKAADEIPPGRAPLFQRLHMNGDHRALAEAGAQAAFDVDRQGVGARHGHRPVHADVHFDGNRGPDAAGRQVVRLTHLGIGRHDAQNLLLHIGRKRTLQQLVQPRADQIEGHLEDEHRHDERRDGVGDTPLLAQKIGAGDADERPVIDHMDLSIKPGQTIALVGPSGGGKSTTCSLLPRFYDVAAGSISIDGQDVRDVTQQSLRRAIGLVQQDVYLFDGTIGENIAYGKPGATAEEIAEAARRANIDSFIESLPQGYGTVVGERGSRLSGGQKQRVAIARVFLKNPKILILDEATSALDNESEEAVQESLEELARGRTTIIIAHRLSTIKHADEIATVEHGRVVERGTHEQLLARGGTYARYYRMQFEGARAHELD